MSTTTDEAKLGECLGQVGEDRLRELFAAAGSSHVR